MTWFDALDECRREVATPNCFHLNLPLNQSTWIFHWINRSWVLNVAAKQTYNIKRLHDRMWLVNAHMHLYNSEYPAWANGKQLEMTARHTAEPNNCNAWSTSRHVVEEDWGVLWPLSSRRRGGVMLSSANHYLIDLNCTDEYTYRAICKRPTGQLLILNQTTILKGFRLYLIHFNGCSRSETKTTFIAL